MTRMPLPLVSAKPGVVQGGGNLGVARLRAGFAQVLGRLEREAGVADFQPVGVANDLHRAVAAVAAVHQGVDHGLADHAKGMTGVSLPLQVALGQAEAFGQVVQDGGLGAADQAEQRVAQARWCQSGGRGRAPIRGRARGCSPPASWGSSGAG
jgi:hypothetical protein